MRIVSVALNVQSTLGPFSYQCRLEPGLNVLNAPNSWGKSTLLQSIVYALGLEGSLSASRRVPLGPAMTQAVETDRGRGSVIESFVTLTVANERGRYMRIRRWAKSLEVNLNLMQVLTADSEAGLDAAARQDMFVREGGATVSEVGFHRLLEEFLGWSLPMVPGFSGEDIRLYLEVVFPLFYVEQKFGWSGVAPRVPTHFRIRDPLPRAVEYVLGLSTLERIRALDALKQEEAAIGDEWTAAVGRLSGAASAESLRLTLPDTRPVGIGQRQPAVLEASIDSQWIPLERAEQIWRDRLAAIGEQVVPAGERTTRSRADLAAAESEVRKLGASLRELQEQLAVSVADQDALTSRLAGIGADKRRLTDVQRIRRFGGELDMPLIAEGRCPTCQQNVDGRDVASGTVNTIEENVALLEAERVTLVSMQAAAQERGARLAESVQAAEVDLAAARQQVRLLRDELVGPSNAPSLSQVQERLTLESRLRGAAAVKDTSAAVEHDLDELSIRHDDVRARRALLGEETGSTTDAAILGALRDSFQQQIEAYGLRSVPPSQVTIDGRTLLPITDGFELTFDLGLGFSASDTIRTKWAYHTALFEAATTQERGHHLGLVVLDEPRQQETDPRSLAAFLNRLNGDRELGQVLYATSQSAEVFGPLLRDIPHNSLPASGPNLFVLSGDQS
ncbi:MAG: hypothetical protein ACLP7J_01100 [Streptosporangiaceae bacterium]